MHVREILVNLGVLVIADQHAVSRAGSTFDDDGNLVNDSDAERIASIAKRLVEVAGRLAD